MGNIESKGKIAKREKRVGIHRIDGKNWKSWKKFTGSVPKEGLQKISAYVP